MLYDHSCRDIRKDTATLSGFGDELGGRQYRPISVYHFSRPALTLCLQLCMGIQPGDHFPARSADALPATLYGHFTQAIYRNRPVGWQAMAMSEVGVCHVDGRGPTSDDLLFFTATMPATTPKQGPTPLTFQLNLSRYGRALLPFQLNLSIYGRALLPF